MSLIGLLTATEKQVHLGRLLMMLIQYHLKNHWRIPESLEKVISIPRSLNPHFLVVAPKGKCPLRSVTTPTPPCSSNLYRCLKRRLGRSGDFTARVTWSLPENKLHINYLVLETVLLALKEFQDLCSNNIVFIATDNTTVAACINKEGGTRLGPLCALLWRLLTSCSRNQVTLKGRHTPVQPAAQQIDH